jgi:hypothetical protein
LLSIASDNLGSSVMVDSTAQLGDTAIKKSAQLHQPA